MCKKDCGYVFFCGLSCTQMNVNQPNKRCLSTFQIYLRKLTPLKIKQDFKEFSVYTDSAKVLSDEQGYIVTRCMFDVFLNLETAEKFQVIFCFQLVQRGGDANRASKLGVFQD